ncbi:zf-HC2 domain-containing protein [Streptacidiphilus carbonis]|uniref:zf-HC2 domain-containing protein n=1 Tax=Streptacidiphilus carbonis TaxID=105422 RepID=UPI0005A8E987|nr:zf-HC2 domain-containing protein [Streptacidiphilus carbonis]
MSQTTPPFGLDSSGHPPVEAIADYLEDLLPDEAAAELGEHLAGCPECLDTHAAIEEIRALLGEAAPVALPGDIAVRIDAALAAEALLSSTAPTATGEPAQAPDADDPDGAAEPAEAPETATAPLQTAGSSHGAGRRSGAAHGPAGPSGPSGPPAPSTASTGPGRNRRRILRRAAMGLAALAVVGVVTVSALQIHTPHSSNGAASTAAGPGNAAGLVPGVQAYIDFTDAALTQQVQALLRHTSPSGGTPRTAAGANATEHSAATPASTVPACVLQAADRSGDRPLTSGQGSYRGTPVFALVYADATNPQQTLDVYLISSACTAATGSQPGQVLLHSTVPRD